MWHAIDKNWPFGQDNQFCAKKTHQNGYFGVHETGSPDFGRTRTPNGWHQVNFRPTPENFGVWRFKLGMWHIFLCVCTDIGEDMNFWFLVISEVRSPDYKAKSAIFKIWVFWVISMYYITLCDIDMHNVRCLEPFLLLYDHFEIWRFLRPNWQY